MLHPTPPWSGYLEAGATGDISMAALPQCEAPSAAASIPAGSATATPALARSLALLLLLWLSLDCSLAQLLLLSPSLVLLLCSDLATLQSTEYTFGSDNFQGLGGSFLRKNHP